MVDAASPDATLALGRRNSIRYDDYASLDARVSRDFTLSRGELTAFVEVTNLTNRRNPCCVDYTYEYQDAGLVLERDVRHWLPLVPSLGVLWKF